ncbi:DMT family transporter [Caenispirillum salinarum]|uniref:DMT family transporter n=1 Tax=Caenispirillum salinarum TaxID=859058 RepID=UPI00384FF8BE
MLATLFFGVMDASIKWLSETYPVPQVTFFRALFGLVPFLPIILRSRGTALRLNRPVPVLLRSLLAPAAMLCIFGSFSLLPLAEATTIAFGAPILMAALGVPLLGERVGWRRWTAILVGFVGVLIAARPDGMTLSAGAALALGGMVLYSLLMVWGRLLTRTDSATGLSLYAMLTTTAIMACGLPWFWVTPTWADLGIMAMMGMSGGVAVYFLTRAFQLAPVAVLSPFDYLNLPVATFTGWLIWRELPAEHVWWGAAVIIASGLFIVYRENRTGRG